MHPIHNKSATNTCPISTNQSTYRATRPQSGIPNPSRFPIYQTLSMAIRQPCEDVTDASHPLRLARSRDGDRPLAQCRPRADSRPVCLDHPDVLFLCTIKSSLVTCHSSEKRCGPACGFDMSGYPGVGLRPGRTVTDKQRTPHDRRIRGETYFDGKELFQSIKHVPTLLNLFTTVVKLDLNALYVAPVP